MTPRSLRLSSDHLFRHAIERILSQVVEPMSVAPPTLIA